MTDTNRPDRAAEMGAPPDELAPEERPVPEEVPSPEEYEPADPDVEAIVDGGTDAGVDDLDAAYPHAGAEQPDPAPDDGVEP